MLTKQQKVEHVKKGKELLAESQSLIFVDFSGTSVEDVKKIRRALKPLGAKMKVIKKRLLGVIFKDEHIDIDPKQFKLQVGTVFSPSQIFETAGTIYKFYKDLEKKGFKISGGYDLSAKTFFDGETMKKIGSLPSREVLLGQLVSMLASPIRMLMFIMSEKSKTVEKQ